MNWGRIERGEHGWWWYKNRKGEHCYALNVYCWGLTVYVCPPGCDDCDPLLVVRIGKRRDRSV